MEQNIATVDTWRAALAGEAATRPTPSDLMKTADDNLDRLAEVRASLDEIQASLNRVDELFM